MNSTSNSIREKSRKSTRSNNTKKQNIPGLNTNQKQKQKIKTNPIKKLKNTDYLLIWILEILILERKML